MPIHNPREAAAAAARKVADQVSTAALARRSARSQGKPTITEDTVVVFIDWIATQLVGDALSAGEATILLRAAELVISKTHAGAQAKPAAGLESTPPEI
jgi:hypothetical protein